MRHTGTSSRPAATRTAAFVEQVDRVLLAGPERRSECRRLLVAEAAGRVARLGVVAARVVADLEGPPAALSPAGLRPPALRRLRRARRPSCRSRRCGSTRTAARSRRRSRCPAPGMRSIVVERVGSAESWNDVPIEVHQPVAARRPGQSARPPPRRRCRARCGARCARSSTSSPRCSTLASINRKTAMTLPPADLYWVHSVAQLPAVALVARYRGVPFVYDAHDFYSDSKNNDGPHVGRPLGHVGVRARRAPVRPLRGRAGHGRRGRQGTAGAALRTAVRGTAQRPRPPARPGGDRRTYARRSASATTRS